MTHGSRMVHGPIKKGWVVGSCVVLQIAIGLAQDRSPTIFRCKVRRDSDSMMQKSSNNGPLGRKPMIIPHFKVEES